MRLIDADRALEIVRDQGIAYPNAYHLTNYATLILREAPTITDLRKCMAFNSAEDDKPQTNADRIRSMSDFEFAKEIENAQSGIEIKNPKNIDYFDCILDWLKQPSGGE